MPGLARTLVPDPIFFRMAWHLTDSPREFYEAWETGQCYFHGEPVHRIRSNDPHGPRVETDPNFYPIHMAGLDTVALMATIDSWARTG